jgi:hypothetical protein
MMFIKAIFVLSPAVLALAVLALAALPAQPPQNGELHFPALTCVTSCVLLGTFGTTLNLDHDSRRRRMSDFVWYGA